MLFFDTKDGKGKEMSLVREILNSLGGRFSAEWMTNEPWPGVLVSIRKEGLEVRFSIGFPEDSPCYAKRRIDPTSIIILVDKRYEFHKPTKDIIDRVKRELEERTRRPVRIHLEA